MNRIGLSLTGLAALVAACAPVSAPEPFGACPSPAQVAWHRQELLMFYHFGQATFSGWDGENATCNGIPWSEALLLEHYAPETLDVDQWVKVAAENDFREVILTTKHHDGFCLWDNPESTCDVASARNTTDVVQAVRDACNRYGVNLGLYLSPWDRTIEAAGLDLDTYEAMYKRSITDLMTRYAPVVEFWIDGNHSADFNWPDIHKTVLDVNPDCLIFSDAGPGCRWVGNERGVAGETNWNTLDIRDRSIYPGHAPGDFRTYLGQGDLGTADWIPAECDFSLQEIGDPDGWFFDATEHRKTPEELLQIYYTSVGRGGVFLMNVPPSPAGILDPVDVASIEGFTALRHRIFDNNLALGADVKASARRGRGFEPSRLLDGNYDSYWAAPDGVNQVELELTLKGEKTFNLVQLQEYIPLGQRISGFRIQVRENGSWEPWTEGTTVGHKRIVKGRSVTADAVRISLDALSCPTLNGLGLYLDPVSNE